MNHTLFRRAVSLTLTLALALSMGLTVFASESQGLCDHHPSHTADCGYEAAGECDHICSTETGCITVPCRHIHDESCYDSTGQLNCTHVCSQNKLCQVPILECLHETHEGCGYTEGKPCQFECRICNPVELKGTDAVLTDGSEYTHTGQEIRPAVTVTVDREELKEKEHYTLTYANNIEVGTGTVVVTGVEEAGYTGTVILPFTIVKAQTPTEPTEPDKPSEPSEPSEPTEPGKPSDPTEPSEPEEETGPEEEFEYKITSGSGSKWRKDSKKDLRFTVNADAKDVTGIRVNGKKVDKTNYTLGSDGLVTLKETWLQKQVLGTHRIAIDFADGSASGSFTVAAAIDPTNPDTGDSIGIWFALMILSLLGGAGLIVLRKKIV